MYRLGERGQIGVQIGGEGSDWCTDWRRGVRLMYRLGERGQIGVQIGERGQIGVQIGGEVRLLYVIFSSSDISCHNVTSSDVKP